MIKFTEIQEKVLKMCKEYLGKEKYNNITDNKKIKECGCTVEIFATKEKQNYVFNTRIDASYFSEDIIDEIQKLQEEDYIYIVMLPDKIKVTRKYVQSLINLNVGLFLIGETVKVLNFPEIRKPDVQRTKVFIASASRTPIRRKVIDIIRKDEFWMFSPDYYEKWAGSSEPPEDTCLKKVDDNDILLGILEEDVGSNDDQLFIKEVKHAKKKNKPIVLLVKEPCKRKKEAKQFLKEMEGKVVHLTFNNKNLKSMVKSGLSRAVREYIE